MNYLIIVMIIMVGLILFWWYSFYHLRTSRILKFIKPTDKILDLGCGDCCLKEQLPIGYNIISMDVVNKSKCNTPIVYDGSNLPDGKYDVVVMAFVLHHVPNLDNLLSQLAKQTNRIILFEDTPMNEMDKFFNRLHSGSDWGSCQKCFLSQEKWVEKMNSHGFKLVFGDNIGRWEFPFAEYPMIYPVAKTFMVFDKNN